MPARPRRSTLPNLKVYRAAWVVALILVVISLFTLGRPDTPKLSLEPVSFDGEQAAADLRTIVTDYPQRVAGTDPDNRLALWVLQQFKRAGLETHIDSFAATINGKDVALQNIWALSRGDSAGTILVIANRDVPPMATQGANDNASGVAALLELARSFTVTAHDHSIIFLCTSGDAYGALGARRFAEDHEIDDLYARDRPSRGGDARPRGHRPRRLEPRPQGGPALALAACRPRGPRERQHGGSPAHRAGPGPAPGGAHQFGQPGAVRRRGVPGITVSAAGDPAPPQSDTLDNVSTETLTKVGSTVQAMIMAIDGTTSPGARSGGTIFLTRSRTLPGGSLALILAAFLLPLAGVTVDLFAHCRRARVALRPAVVRAGLHLAPWLVVLAIVYLANLLGQLPRSPGAVIPPGSRVVDNPRYLRVVILVALLVLAYGYAVAVARRLERRVAIDPRATIFIAHAFLVLVAVLALLINPYAVLLVLPAALIWPLAKPGGWARSILPAYSGLIMIPVVLVYYAALLGIGWKVWWYFFLLLENRTIPAAAVLLGVLFLSTAGILAHTMHERGLAPGALTWPAIDRRSGNRMSDEEWTAGLGLESPRERRKTRRQRRRRPRRPDPR